MQKTPPPVWPTYLLSVVACSSRITCWITLHHLYSWTTLAAESSMLVLQSRLGLTKSIRWLSELCLIWRRGNAKKTCTALIEYTTGMDVETGNVCLCDKRLQHRPSFAVREWCLLWAVPGFPQEIVQWSSQCNQSACLDWEKKNGKKMGVLVKSCPSPQRSAMGQLNWQTSRETCTKQLWYYNHREWKTLTILLQWQLSASGLL